MLEEVFPLFSAYVIVERAAPRLAAVGVPPLLAGFDPLPAVRRIMFTETKERNSNAPALVTFSSLILLALVSSVPVLSSDPASNFLDRRGLALCE